MIPRLVPEISPLYAFCDVVVVGVEEVVVVGIGDSRSWMGMSKSALYFHIFRVLKKKKF